MTLADQTREWAGVNEEQWDDLTEMRRRERGLEGALEQLSAKLARETKWRRPVGAQQTRRKLEKVGTRLAVVRARIRELESNEGGK